jgi:hypothetical protein
MAKYSCPFCRHAFDEERAGSGGLHRCPSCSKLFVSQDDVYAHARENPVEYDEEELGLDV